MDRGSHILLNSGLVPLSATSSGLEAREIPSSPQFCSSHK